MGVKFTEQQQRVIDARNHNILVSAAAGSGKTAVLVERIVELVTEGEHPLDIDRLLVVTFTKAAAAEMRERVSKAISARLEADPENRHLQQQETLLHNAQITTIDSFCAFLLRNNFGDIGLDPGFRQMDEMESRLLMSDALDDCLEEQYAGRTPQFESCCEYFCSGIGDDELRGRILELYRKAMSHPWPDAYYEERAKDYDVRSAADLMTKPWLKLCLDDFESELREYAEEYDELRRLCDVAGGPFVYADFLADEQEKLYAVLNEGKEENPEATKNTEAVRNTEAAKNPEAIKNTEETGTPEGAEDGTAAEEPGAGFGEIDCTEQWNRLSSMLRFDFKTLPAVRGKVKGDIDPSLKDAVKNSRDRIRKKLQADAARYFAEDAETVAAKMDAVRGPLCELIRLTRAFADKYAEIKREKNVIDFNDLEHFALQILIDRHEDGTETVRPAAISYREHFKEILIDEYQDSNDVQELLLSTISGEQDGRNNRFMVGDVKQSIYKFRLARPEIFMEKFASYKADDEKKERIDLDRNFRSRAEVLTPVNDIFRYICRPEIGGVDYDEAASLKPGNTSYPSYPEAKAEILMICEEKGTEKDASYEDGRSAAGGNSGTSGGESSGASDAGGAADGNGTDGISVEELNRQQKEALAIAHRIHDLIRNYKVTDGKTLAMRPCRYSDMVILLRTTAGWDEEFRRVFEQEGIPCYVASRAGYFATEEIREILRYMRVLDNPRQDIPLYGALTGFFGGFTEEEIALIKGAQKAEIIKRRAGTEPGTGEEGKTEDPQETDLYAAVCLYAAAGETTGPDAVDRGEEPFTAETEGKSGGGEAAAGTGYDAALSERLRRFLKELDAARESLTYLSIHEFMVDLVARTGYENYIAAMPAGGQRLANLEMLLGMALDFEKTSYTGLFRFIRYIDQMKVREIDFGEANILDENADVVRIMTIHKSKGLEFPIVFCAGLSKQLNMRDATGTLLSDNDLGLGLDYADPALRVRGTTLRKEIIADRIRRDSLGEELRVLYVALTRAKEKLILTAYVKEPDKKKDAAALRVRKGLVRLPVNLIRSAGCYYDLILYALTAMEANNEPIAIGETMIDAADLVIREAEEGTGEMIRRAALSEIENAAMADGIRALPVPEMAAALLKTYSFRYPHEDLDGLYTKTTVTELKRAAVRDRSEEERLAKESDGIQLYPQPAGSRSGAERGTIIHRFLCLMDYARFPRPEEMTADALRDYVRELIAGGQFREEEAAYLTPEVILPFLSSGLAGRMARAAAKGRLRKEQPFVMGIEADRIDPKFPAAETLLIQGIIDAYFEEDGELIVVDYKTDRVRREEELLTRYRVQLDYYAEALGKMYGLPVREKLIYSFALKRVVKIRP